MKIFEKNKKGIDTKAIINGLLYDTEKSDLIGQAKTESCIKQFYKTKKGRMFMFEIPFSRLNRILIDEDEVKEELQTGIPDKYIELFGEVEEA